MSKRAVILCGGLGTRLRPYTVVFPKPLMPVGEYPILEIVVRQLVGFGFNHITMAVNHQADLIKAFFGSGEKWNIKIDYSLEDMPLGTMGPLKLIKDLPENFLIMNGDVLTNLDFAEFYDYHADNNNIFTISSYLREEKAEYGVLEVVDNILTSFKEKPIVKYNVSMGIYMANKRILKYIPDNKAYGFDNLMLDLIDNKEPAHIKQFKDYWLDIGRPDDYEKATDQFLNNKNIFLKDIV